MRSRLERAPAAVAVLLAAGLVACGGGTKDEGAGGQAPTANGRAAEPIPPGKAPASVSIALRDDVDSFNPAKAVNTVADLAVFDAVYGTLVSLSTAGPDPDGVLPNFAKSWEVESPTTVRFDLHEGLSCADGTALKPSDIATSLEWLGDKETAATFGARMFGPGGLKSVAADDAANTVTVTAAKPYADLLEGMSVAYIVCPSAIEDQKALAQKPAPTGAYDVASIKRGSEYALKRREGYTALPEGMTLDQYPGELKLRVVQDESTTANLLQTGQVDIGAILGQEVERLRNVPSLTEVKGAGFGSANLIFNHNDGRLGADPDVRRAFAHAIDAEGWSKGATFGVSPAIDTIYTPNMPCYDEANGELTPAYDLEKAKQILADAGWKPGADGVLAKDGKPLSVRVLGHNLQNSGPDFLADSLEKLGAKVKVQNGTFTNAVGVLFGSGEWDVFVFPFSAEVYYPSNVGSDVRGTLESGSVNVGGIDNAEYNELFAEAVGTRGEDACALWSKAEAAILRDVETKPLVWETAAWFGNGMSFQAQYWKVDLRTIRAAG